MLEKRRSSMSSAEEGENLETFMEPPPDGGLRAWSQVFCAHLVFFNSWGVNNAFVVFQKLYTETIPQSASDISWIAGVQVFLLLFVGVFSGRATDAGYFHLLHRSGIIIQAVGFFMLSLSKTYWQIFLSQGVAMGVGSGLFYTPTLTVMSSYFKTRYSLAAGITVAGGGVGAMVYPSIVNQMMYHHHVGFAWTVRIASLVLLVAHIPGVFLLKPRVPPRTVGPLLEWSAFGEAPFALFTLGMFLIFLGLYVPLFYLATYSRDQIGDGNTLQLILVLHGAGVVGRVIPGLVADRWTGRLNTLIVFSFLSAITIYTWMAVSSRQGLYAFAAIYGFMGCAVQTSIVAAAMTVILDIKTTGTRLGMMWSIIAIAALAGPPIAGALVDFNGGRYEYAQILAGTFLLAGTLVTVAARVAKTGWVLMTLA